MLDLDCVTLVMVATRDHVANKQALKRCLDRAKFREVLVFTSAPAEYKEHRCIMVEPQTSQQWSVWRLTGLPKLRRHFADFTLFIESDASIVNAGAWRSEFLKYDYIGAKWADGVVGNSGFCLQSQKLWAALEELRLPPTEQACHPCDIAMCYEQYQDGRRLHRRRLEDAGVRFADAELADQFSNEIEYRGAFGVHGLKLLPMLAPILDQSSILISLPPDDVATKFQRALAARASGNLALAAKLYAEICAKKPREVSARVNLSSVLEALGRFDEAAACCEDALKLDPGNADAHNNLGVVQLRRYRLCEAALSFKRAAELRPDFFEAYSNWSAVLRDMGDCAGSLRVLDRAQRLSPRADAGSSELFTLSCSAGVSAADLAESHRRWGVKFAPSTLARAEHKSDRSPERRLRVGYLSPDFRRHSVASFIEPVLREHDRSQVELVAYFSGAPDKVTERLSRYFTLDKDYTCWRSVAKLSDVELADLVRADGIDVLVDLAGHTAGNRLPALAYRPAPVQLTYLGYGNWSGMPEVHRVTDSVIDQSAPELATRLPSCCLAWQPPEAAPEVGSLPALARGGVTFGSFNAAHKLNPAVIDLWARILIRVPGSRLILKCPAFTDPEVREIARAHFIAAGTANVALEPFRADYKAHLELYGQVDIALDPFPYCGVTTTCEAAYAGVPTLTLAGDRPAARFGASINTALGLGAYVVASEEEYLARAIDLAGDLRSLAVVRSNMRAWAQGALCSAAAAQRVARGLEGTYRQLWREWCRKEGRDGE